MKIFDFMKKKRSPPQDCDAGGSFRKILCDKAISECRTLYPADESITTWSCGSGWYPIISKLSYELEAVNILYKKYGIVVVADQVKEKFGTLRFYCTTSVTPPLVYDFLCRFLISIKNCISRHVNFKIVTVVDRGEHTKLFVRRLSKEEYSRLGRSSGPNTWFHNTCEPNGEEKYYRVVKSDVCAKTHPRPTKHRLLYHFNKFLVRHASEFDFSWIYCKSKKRQIMLQHVQTKVEELVRKAEHDCGEVCEDCGRPFDDGINPRCETVGYIRYVCEKCAKLSGMSYYKDKQLFNGMKHKKNGEDGENQK